MKSAPAKFKPPEPERYRAGPDLNFTGYPFRPRIKIVFLRDAFRFGGFPFHPAADRGRIGRPSKMPSDIFRDPAMGQPIQTHANRCSDLN